MNNQPTQGYNSGNDVEQNKVYAILAYIGFLCFVPLLAAKESPFARYHAGQGLTLFILEVAIGLVGGILGWIPVLGLFFTLITSLASAGCLVLAIIGILNASSGKAIPLPLIGGISFLN